MLDVLRHLLFVITKGVIDISKIMEDLLKELYEQEKYETTVQIVNKMLEAGTLSLEKIAKYSGLTLEEVKELAQQD